MNTWWRIGVTIPMTEDEIKVLLNSKTTKELKNLVAPKLLANEFEFNGECYMPEECVEDLSPGREYDSLDISFDM